ncbi:Peptidoglycan recognition protein 3 [Lamellibrachia satsuma]|nr:Peptidoglycan recognition protein 3 [Lamellibrachia satsuma]
MLGGHCQSANTCVGGHYKKGLCAGNARRKCCILDGLTKLPAGSCGNLRIVTRQEWGAQPRKGLKAIARNPTKILFIHHEGSGKTCTNDCAKRVKDIQTAHKRKWSDIGYNYLVGDDGRAYEGRGWGYRGAHTWGYNSIAVGICAIGNFEKEQPSRTILQAIASLIACAKDEASITCR